MRRLILLLALSIFYYTAAFATGEPSTFFNIYVPPNNDPVRRDVALVVTAINDSTTFTIEDDGADGDTDDSKTGVLMAGQSYILYIRDNGINDDAQYASGGVLKQDGDYFIIRSSGLVYASISTDSDWQHDFAPSVNKKSVGGKFIIYSPKASSLNRDLNVFAFEDNTTVTISKISTSATTQSGYTHVDITNKIAVAQRTINRGQDLIYTYPDGRNVMLPGETYVIEANKGVSVQYGALYGNERDGGGQVPASNGSSSGSLFYFAVPYQAVGEQEIRIVSWDDQNAVQLERYLNGAWVVMKNWNLNRLKPADWVGKANGNVSYNTIFRVTCTPGKRVSVLEANWMETGAPGTSDMATMLASESGTTAGTDFLGYLLPPGNETRVVNPFTGLKFGGSFAHFYLFASKDTTVVTVKDAATNGTKINRTYTILPFRYADSFFSLAEWKSIYNGTGTTSGPERPYLLIESTKNISVMSSNSNDNWMMYFGSSLGQSFSQNTISAPVQAIPGDTIRVVTSIVPPANQTVTAPTVEVRLGSGALPLSSTLTNLTTQTTIVGDIAYGPTETLITFPNVPNIRPQDAYQVTTTLIVSASENDGSIIKNGSVLSSDIIVTGFVDGTMQQSLTTVGIANLTANTSKLLFNNCGTAPLTTALTDSWNGAWIDYDGDGWEDLFITDKNEAAPNLLFRNTGNGAFTRITTGPLVTDKAKTAACTWADIDNDGRPDAFVANATGKPSVLYRNTGNGGFTVLTNTGIDVQPQYFHGATWFDYDNDGFVDLLITNFFQTRFHQLYHNNGNLTFTAVTNTPLTQESNRSTAPVCADYNHDGLVDVFIPNGDDQPSSLFTNLGGGRFRKVTTGSLATDHGNAVGATWGDYDNDGWLDLFVTRSSSQPNRLYRNLHDGTFASITIPGLTTDRGQSHGASWVDLDNDADLDMYVTNDVGTKFLYLNDGNGQFTRKRDEVITADFGLSFGQSWADYNKDGYLDAAVFTHGAQPNWLFCNNAGTNHWVNIRLEGRASNRSALGSRVRVKAGGQWQVRQVSAQNGFGSQNSLRQHVGLGDATTIDSLEVHWPSGYVQYLTGLSTNQFLTITEDAAARVTGTAFHDRNGNCLRDANEPIIASSHFRVSPTNLLVTTDAAGRYDLRLPAGSYQLALLPNAYWAPACPATLTVPVGLGGNFSRDLPLTTAIATGYDLAVTHAETAWRRGFANQALIQVENNGSADAYQVVVQATYPSAVRLTRADRPFTNVANTYTWTLDTVRAGSRFTIQVTDSVTLLARVGDVLPLAAEATASGTDLNPANNRAATTVTVVGAIDPNDLAVSPRGEGAEGFVSKNQLLTYTVRFQNVGTSYASRVVIQHQLPDYLDRGTLQVIGASHPHQLTVDDGGQLIATFNGIYLPDSIADEPGSHGHLRFTIAPRRDLHGGEELLAQAQLTFDFEDAIATNSVRNTIRFSPDGQRFKLLVSPNPATGPIRLQLDPDYFKFDPMPGIQAITVSALTGRRVLTQTGSQTPLANLDISVLSPGVYVVEVTDSAGNRHTERLVVGGR